jgi:acyl-CoA synthetase (AMP-forming)/AMP-acid ligase II
MSSYSNQTALIDENRGEVNYHELIQRGDAWAAKIPNRCLVISMVSNTVEFVAAYTGFIRNNIVQLLVNESTAHEFLVKLIEVYSPNYILFPDSYKILLSKVRTFYSHNGYHLIDCKNFNLRNYNKLELNSELALLISTSGTTGSSKLVRLSHQNINTNTQSIINYLGIENTERSISTMPLSYSYGLSILNTHLSAGASMVLTESSTMSREFWRLMKEHNVTSFGGVPYLYEILDKLKFESLHLPSLKYATQAGGKLSVNLAKKFTQIFSSEQKRFYIMYGQTEATARISYLCATDYPEKIGSIGVAIPGCEIWVENERGEKIIKPGEQGELICRGENVSMGFAENSNDLSLPDINSSVLKTGDYAIFDSDGFFSIVGRKSRFIKLYGLRINLQELEEILLLKGFKCACSGSDQYLNIYLTEQFDERAIKSIIFNISGIHPNGFRVIKIESFPRTSSGKINYALLD